MWNGTKVVNQKQAGIVYLTAKQKKRERERKWIEN